jgi:hypothetical protein
MLGPTATTLGVRLPDPSDPEASPDITPDANGFVSPNTGGMSVSPSQADLPAHRIPRKLRLLYPKASGNNAVRIWSLGEGRFEAAPVNAQLALRPDPHNAKHGFVEPSFNVPIASYVAALESTQSQWRLDEGGET